MKKLVIPMLAVGLACGQDNHATPNTMDEVAEQYVRLVLALGVHDGDYVDAYYGDPTWRTEVEAEAKSIADIRVDAQNLIDTLRGMNVEHDEALVSLRHQYLTRQLESLVAKANLLNGVSLSFDDESSALYDAKAPVNDEAYFEGLLTQLDDALPGDGPLHERYNAFRNQFVIPTSLVDTVFKTAIAECRAQTVAYVDLPEDESFTIEYVNDKPWSGYNWYQGEYQSLIQVNTDLPIFIDRAIDLACHEGYPGHHVYNVLLEKNLMRDRGWVEYSVYPLFSPQSLIAEGSANYGIEVSFPGEARVALDRDVLFPLAGLDPNRAEEYHRVLGLAEQIDYAGNEAARRYLNGEISGEEAAEWLGRYALMAPERARQRVAFFDTYRSYVINYNLGRDLVRSYVERGADEGDPEARWARFSDLLASPRLPSGLVE